MQNIEKTSSANQLTAARRWSGVFSVGLTVLLLIFFALHQKDQTGFFTSKFGPAEMVALYLPILISMIAPTLRMLQGSVEPARMVELISDICLAVGSIWLRHIFPFDFARFAALFPSNYQFAFAWLNDGVGRIILLLQIILGFISALATLGTYLSERGILAMRTPEPGNKDDPGNNR